MKSFEEIEKVWIACSQNDEWENLVGDTITNIALNLAEMLMKVRAPITPDNVNDLRVAILWGTKHVLESAYMSGSCSLDDESIIVMALEYFGDITEMRSKSAADIAQLAEHGDTVAIYVQETKMPVKEYGMTPPQKRRSSSPTFLDHLMEDVLLQTNPEETYDWRLDPFESIRRMQGNLSTK